MSSKSTFAELFNVYRLKSGLDTYAKLGEALAEEGIVYEDSIFSKWKSGQRIPKDRHVILALIRIFKKQGGIRSIEEADLLLNSVGLRRLDKNEQKDLALSVENIDAPFSKYKPLVEPSSLFQEIAITDSNLRILNLNSITIPYIRDYWYYQVRCGVSDFYTNVSGGEHPPEYFFNLMDDDQYSRSPNTTTFVIIYTDPSTGLEYLASDVRFVQGIPNDKFPLPFMHCFGIKDKWPHQLSNIRVDQAVELDRFVLPNWAWLWRKFIVRKGFESVKQYALNLDIKIIYAMLSKSLLDLCQQSNIDYSAIHNTFPLYMGENVKDRYVLAYIEAYGLSSVWSQKPGVYEIKFK